MTIHFLPSISLVSIRSVLSGFTFITTSGVLTSKARVFARLFAYKVTLGAGGSGTEASFDTGFTGTTVFAASSNFVSKSSSFSSGTPLSDSSLLMEVLERVRGSGLSFCSVIISLRFS